MTENSGALFAASGSAAVIGLGMSVLRVSCTALIQEIASPFQRGNPTVSNLFLRNLGDTLGATEFGAIVNDGLAHTHDAPHVTSGELGRLLPSRTETSAAVDALRLALHNSLRVMFLWMFATSRMRLLC
ncbi:hypothetical protein [Paraburkholderia dipogonis]|uniref:hypothetical protein n=1 Tax=Paraburkholderia dipogonis TaxID=1211383 RepID=UPI0038BB3178